MTQFFYSLNYLLFVLFFVVSPARDLFAFDHSAYNEILKKHAHSDGVNFQNLPKDASRLDQYLDSFHSISWDEISRFPREEQLAFWINAYNALMLNTLTDSKSKNPVQLVLEDRSLSLREIRDEILRRRFRDERIHFALLTASPKGPALRREPYTGARLDYQLDEQIRNFLLNYPAYDTQNTKFTPSQLAVLSFIVQHSSQEIVKYLGDAKYKILYFPSDSNVDAPAGQSKGHLN